MSREFSLSSSSDDNSTVYGIPSNPGADAKVEVLAEILNDLLAELVNDGRMSRAEERTWRAAADAVVLDRPELIGPGGTIIAEAEQIARAATLD